MWRVSPIVADIPSLSLAVVEDSDALRVAMISMLLANGDKVSGVFCAEDIDNAFADSTPMKTQE